MIGTTFNVSSLGGRGLKAGMPIRIGLARVAVGAARGWFTVEDREMVEGASTVGPTTMGCMVLETLLCRLDNLSIAAWLGRLAGGAIGCIIIRFCLPRF